MGQEAAISVILPDRFTRILSRLLNRKIQYGMDALQRTFFIPSLYVLVHDL